MPRPSASAFTYPYRASWFDRFCVAVDRLPVPWWLAYVLLAFVSAGLVAIVLSRSGVYASVGVHPMQVWLPILPWYLLGLAHGLDRLTQTAMTRFRPAFRGSESDFALALYRMTTLPAGPAVWVTLIGAALSVPIGQFEFKVLQTGGLDRVPGLLLLLMIVVYLAGWLFFYHAWHQLREIHRLYLNHAQVRLPNVRPLYALSQVTSLTALGLTIQNYGWTVAQPGDFANPVNLAEGGSNLLIALIVFAWPLWGAHRLLVEAKERDLGVIAQRKESARSQLYRAVDRGSLRRVDPLHKVLGALEAEAVELNKIPTWPWSPGTLRNLMGAVLLPMVLWLIQFSLQRLLG